MHRFHSIDDLRNAIGVEIGPSPWLEVDQSRVDAFADATDDHQWIHVDVARAADGPFGGTIAHGYLTLSLLPWFASRLYRVEIDRPRLNYGINRVRFPQPVLVGARIRSTVTVAEVTDTPTGHQVSMRFVVMAHGMDRPVCVAETVVLFTG